jgi:hypothetical protein
MLAAQVGPSSAGMRGVVLLRLASRNGAVPFRSQRFGGRQTPRYRYVSGLLRVARGPPTLGSFFRALAEHARERDSARSR